VNRTATLLAGAAIAALAFAACGGGGGGTSPAPASLAAPAKIAAPPAAGRTSYGTARVALILPAAFTGKNAKAIRARAGAGRKSPAYVNPQSGTVLDIFVDGSLLSDLDNSVGAQDSLYVAASSDSTQVLTLPVFSTSNNDVVVVEWDSTAHNSMLSVGEAWVGSFASGQAVNVTISMLMNTRALGILDVYHQADPEVMSGQTYYGLNQSCGAPAAQAQFGIWEADAIGTFVPVAGYGGTSLAAVTAQPNYPGTTTAGQTTISGLYQVNWDGGCDGVVVSAGAANPAYPIVDTENVHAPAPYTDGYDKCYLGTGPCPAGPYQGLWELYWVYDQGSAFYLPQSQAQTQTVSGYVNITASPSPAPT
jgi:hypothetical protein